VKGSGRHLDRRDVVIMEIMEIIERPGAI